MTVLPAARPDTTAPAVALDRGGVRYGERWVWRDASFRVARGTFTAVVGPNGAGKSTLLRTLLGLLPLEEGTLALNGRPPRRGDPQVGYMPQLRPLDPDLAIRGRDVVRFGVDGHRWGVRLRGEAACSACVDRAIEAVGAAGYATRRIGALSGGERQRLLLAQALVAEPRLLLLDEPLANVDLANRAAIVALTASLVRERGIAVMLVTHDVNDLLPYVDTVVYVANGRVAAGRPDAIITSAALSDIYDAPVEVVRDSRGRCFVVGPDAHGWDPRR